MKNMEKHEKHQQAIVNARIKSFERNMVKDLELSTLPSEKMHVEKS